MKKRLCLTEYKTFTSNKFLIEINSDTIKMLVRELDENKKFLKSYSLADGDVYFPAEKTKYLAIGIYNADSEYGMTYEKYVSMFNDGVVARLVGSNEQIISTATPAPKVYSSFREELKDMLLTGDMTTHDVWKYKITYNKMMNIYNGLIADECYVAYKSYVNVYLDYTISYFSLVKTVRLANADEGFAYRYEKIQEARAETLALVKPEMSEVEKVLILQEYLAKKTSYEFSDYCRVVSGPLVYGKAVCAGYARTLQFLLHEAGIDSYYTASETMNHGWLMVRVDGELYHVDPTWDDNKGSLHTFFMRNDNEYQNHPLKNHYDWYIKDTTEALTSTSTKYENWFVHDVKGVMAYYEGYWYYGDGKTIKRAKIDGSDMSIVSEENESVLVKEIKNGTLIYTANNVRKTIKLSE